MNILILTNHLKNFAGSEVQALEIYEYFKQNNHIVKIYANYIGDPIKCYFQNEDIISDIDNIDLNNFDLVWSQHCIFARLFKNKIYDNLKLKLISVHLSPFELLELSSFSYMNQLNATFVANSEETKQKLLEFLIPEDKIVVSGNPAPDVFKQAHSQKTLQKILVVSNHVPKEIFKAADILRKHHITIDFLGIGNQKQERITPNLINQYDVVITIGKIVQYGLLSQIPIYNYDHFGGCGYLLSENFEKAQFYNFSGRGFNQKTAEEIAEEIQNNFLLGQKFSSEFNKYKDFTLSHFIEKLLKIVTYSLINEQEIQLIKLFYPLEERFSSTFVSLENSHEYNQHLRESLGVLNDEISKLKQEKQNLIFQIKKLKTITPSIHTNHNLILKEIYKSPSYLIIRAFKKINWKLRNRPKKPLYYPQNSTEGYLEAIKILTSTCWTLLAPIHAIFNIFKKNKNF